MDLGTLDRAKKSQRAWLTKKQNFNNELLPQTTCNFNTVETWCPAELRRIKKEAYKGYAYDVKMWSISRIYIKM